MLSLYPAHKKDRIIIFSVTDDGFYNIYKLYDCIYTQIALFLWRSDQIIDVEGTFTAKYFFYSNGGFGLVNDKKE